MKKISYFLILFLMLSISEIVFSQCVTSYTSFSGGDFATGSNWVGGIAPPNPIPPGVTVTIGHVMSNSGTIENNGNLTASVGSFTNNSGATYRGTGTFTGNFINNGTVSPGSTMVAAQLVTAPIAAITGTAATSGGSICYGGGSAIIEKGVCWSTAPNPDISLPTKTSDGMGTGTFMSSITGLSGLTTYYVRAYATNGTATAYGNEVSFTTIAACPTGTITHGGFTYGVVASAGGKCWLDRNLGATQVATSSTDTDSYGDLFQWGRGADGHQLRTSSTTTTHSSTDTPGHGNFIVVIVPPFDWRSTQNDNLWQGVSGVNNPCPSGYRLPTETELNNERTSWSSNNAAGAFASPLKLPLAGYRAGSSGDLLLAGDVGRYWTSIVSSNIPTYLTLDNFGASFAFILKNFGHSVRCIKEDGPLGAIGSIDCGGATNTGTLTSGVAASGVSSSVPYTGGNGGSHAGQTVTSTGVTGLTAYLYPGVFASGSGSLSYGITGTPANAGTASFALNIGGQMCTLTRTVAPSVPNTCNPSNPTAIVDVINSSTGKTWMDRNLGATRAATSSIDDQSYGSLFQWGRGADGHQCVNRYAGDGVTTSTNTLANATVNTDTPPHGNFIIVNTGNLDWRSPQNNNLWQGVSGINNPCPSGYRLPTETELDNERLSWSPNNNAAGAIASPLKLPLAGSRNSVYGSLSNVGTFGGYWSSTVSGTVARYLNFNSSVAFMDTYNRAFGFSVRCLKEDGPVGAIGSIDCSGATHTGTLTSGVAASGVSSSVPYASGNGGSHAGQTVTSTGVTGLTAYLYPGVFATGAGSLIYTITGTPTSSGTASFALNIGGQMCTLELTVAAPPFVCGTSTVTFTYNGGSVTYGTVERAYGGSVGTKCWLDRNLGASQVATSSTDYLSYGDLFQWGRLADGHQTIVWTSATTSNGAEQSNETTTLSTTDVPGNTNFIKITNSPNDWRSPQNDNLWQGVNGVNNPCPSGFRVPTAAEIDIERASWGSNQNSVGAFNSPLKLPVAGYRDSGDGSVNVGFYGFYWSGTLAGINSRGLLFYNGAASVGNEFRASGFSVRCLKD